MDAETSRQIAELRSEIADARAKMAGLLGRAGGYVTGQIDLNGWLQLWKQSSVDTPGTDKVRITVVDKAGDESVVAIFDDGSTIELANQGSGIGPHAMAIHTDEDTWHAGLAGASLHDPKAHVMVSSTHTASGLTAGHVIRATGATTFAWQQLMHNDLGGVTANQHHSQQHAIVGSDHTASGLTAGHVIRATGATAFAWQQLQHGDLGGIGASDHHDPVTAGDGIAVTGQQVAVDLASPSGLSFTGGDLQLDDSVAGDGLTIAGKALAVGAGDGIAVTADAVAVDLASQAGLTFDSAKLKVNAGNGLAISGNLLQHGSGDFGDLHTNYAEHDQGETITGAWTFEGDLTARHIYPQASDAYDIGSSTKLWRKGWFSELDSVLFARQTITLIGGWFSLVKYANTVNEDVDDTETEIDFGSDSIPPNMNADDFVIFRRVGAVEYMQLVSHSGSGVWTVTRNVDGSGANTWAKGSPFANYGYDGTGRIDIDAQTGGPRFRILEQGTAYNSLTERLRIGDLNGWGPISSEAYGWAVGDYSGNEYAYYEPGQGLKIRGTITADDGTLVNLSVTGTLTLSGSGKLITAASPSPRIELTTSLLAGYSDGTTKQFWMQASDGKAYAGGGDVTLDSDGVTLGVGTGLDSKKQLKWGSIAYLQAYSSVGDNFLALKAQGALNDNIAVLEADYVRVAADYFTVGLGNTASKIYLYRNTTLVGQLSTNDSYWFRINQDIDKGIYTPRLFRTDGGLASGNITPGATNLGVVGTIYVKRGGTNYAGLINTHRYFKQATGDYTIQTSWADTGFSQTITVPSGGYVHVVFTGMTQITNYSAAYDVWLRLVVDGAQKAAQVAKTGVRQWDTEGMCLNWEGSVTAGSRVVKIQAYVTGAGTYVLKQDYSQMTIMVYA